MLCLCKFPSLSRIPGKMQVLTLLLRYHFNSGWRCLGRGRYSAVHIYLFCFGTSQPNTAFWVKKYELKEKNEKIEYELHEKF